MKRMIRHISILMALAILAGCSQPQAMTKSQELAHPTTSRFHSLELKTGMNREDVERQIAVLLGQQETYSPYGNNLSGGTVQYPDGDWILEVTYKTGAPAPWVETADGGAEHLPPIDETVVEYRIERIPNQELKATGKPAPSLGR